MPVKLLMGNEALGLGAIHAGVNFVSGYPGTPSTEVLETVAKNNDGSIHVEWSTNEKAALEAAAGASYAGARSLVTMKQVGLNVASDPLMTLAYIGVEGGLVLVVADDPGPISSQTEQDTRNFAQFAKVPVLDPSSPGEAYGMIQDAFEISERHHCPVIVRPTTRVSHACGTVKTRGGTSDCEPAAGFEHPELSDTDKYWDQDRHVPAGFVKDTQRWVVFPRTSYLNHLKVEERRPVLAAEFDSYQANRIELSESGDAEATQAYADALRQLRASDASATFSYGIVCGGISYQYVLEACKMLGCAVPVFKVSTPYPFPEGIACAFLDTVSDVLVVEELDPVIERELFFLCGKHGLHHEIRGKLDATFSAAGEQSTEAVAAALVRLGIADKAAAPAPPERPELSELPVRPPVLCAGCPHRGSFYAVKKATKGRKAVYCGDIGCYTLGNAQPLDMVDTCLCMGADITVAQGIETVDPDALCFSFIGDSTFFASGITGIINAVYNHHDIIVCVLDNSTTAMTGHQPHPGTGKTMMGVDGAAMSIPAIVEAIGVTSCVTVDALDLDAACAAVTDALDASGVRVIIFKSPCIAVSKPQHPPVKVDADACTACHSCIREIGCPAIVERDGQVAIDEGQCYGCELCVQVCPMGAIVRGGGDE